jgi:hypothetical protein
VVLRRILGRQLNEIVEQVGALAVLPTIKPLVMRDAKYSVGEKCL